jgi:hypothetical protein
MTARQPQRAARKGESAPSSGVRRLDITVSEEDFLLFQKAASQTKPSLSLVGWARTVLRRTALAAAEEE